MPVAVRHGSPDVQPDVFPATYQSGRMAGMPHPRAGQANPEAGQYGYGWGRIATGDLPRLTPEQVAAHIRSGRADGIGVICGRASGGVFMLEAEGRARDLLAKVKEAAAGLGCLHLLERLAAGCVDESPSGGLHFYGRVVGGDLSGNDVLAARPNPAAERGQDVLFETREQGGWSAVAPSAGRTHKSGKAYRFLRGGPSTIPTFTPDEFQQLKAAFRAVDERPAPEPVEARATTVGRRERPAGDILPGDDFNQRTTWEEILTPAGWTRGQVVGDRQHWTRPGKGHGTSATTTGDVLCCFSSSAGLPVFDTSSRKNGLSKFATYAHLNHGGDFKSAARALWELGYGSRNDDGPDDGGQPVPVAPRPMPAGDYRTLDDWRTEAAARLADAVGRRGVISLDAGPTGAGKSHNTTAALQRASSSLTVLPTHANVVERVGEMQAAGIDAVAFPELNADTCQQFDAASRAQSLGLVAGAAVCPSCDFKDVCTYRAAVKAAESAAHRVGTHERLRRSSKAAEGVQAVVVDESPETVLFPTLTVSVKQLAGVEALAHGILNHWYSKATVDQKRFALAMRDIMDGIHATCADITAAGVQPVGTAAAGSVPDNWQRLLFDHIRMSGCAAELEADALTLVTKAAAGELESLRVVTDVTPDGRLHHFVVGAWRPALPADAAVILLDATGNADDIAAVVGRPVVDCTPSGHLPLQRPVVQIPDDISRGTSSSTVAGLVEAFLNDHPEVQRLGIIGHSNHVRDLIDGDLLSTPARARLAKWCYFGQGPDRASNDWHDECDHLLRLGTPRANPGDYRRWLVRHGLEAAAGRPDGDWGRRDWEAVTVDGQPVVVQGAGYADADWHRAYVAVSGAAGRQADGRGRAILPGGIPVTILSNEPGPYPIAPSLTTTRAVLRETVEVVRRLGQQDSSQPLLAGSAKTPIWISYREFCASGWFPAGAVEQALMAAAGIKRRAAQVRLSQCVDAGLLVKPTGKRGWYALPESSDATVPDLPVTPPPATIAQCNSPRPAVVARPVQAVVISTHGPAGDAPAVDVVADCIPETTTATCTATAPPAAAAGVDDLVALIDERAAIMEHDGGMDRETADRLAREAVLGRDAATTPPADDIVVSVDHASLHARQQPYVQQVLHRFPGAVRLIGDRDDPFASSRNRATARCRPGQCRCGRDDQWVQVPVHGGKSVRVDCGHCDRFGWFAVWHGRRMPSPGGDDDAGFGPAGVPVDALNCTVQFDAPVLAAAG